MASHAEIQQSKWGFSVVVNGVERGIYPTIEEAKRVAETAMERPEPEETDYYKAVEAVRNLSLADLQAVAGFVDTLIEEKSFEE